MITVLIIAALIWWTYWSMFRHVGSPQPTTAPVPGRRTTGKTTALGLEDDPDQWHATRGAWTALDDFQLTRLLTDSAPINPATTKSTDNAVPQVEQGDTP